MGKVYPIHPDTLVSLSDIRFRIRSVENEIDRKSGFTGAVRDDEKQLSFELDRQIALIEESELRPTVPTRTFRELILAPKAFLQVIE